MLKIAEKIIEESTKILSDAISQVTDSNLYKGAEKTINEVTKMVSDSLNQVGEFQIYKIAKETIEDSTKILTAGVHSSYESSKKLLTETYNLFQTKNLKNLFSSETQED